MFCARASLIFPGFSRDGVPSMKETSLSCMVSSVGTWANKMGLVERDDIDGVSNDRCG